jgi:hypothetical protein
MPEVLRRLDEEWQQLPSYNPEDARPSQVSFPEFHLDIHNEQRSSGKPSAVPADEKHGVTIARWQFWTALVVAVIGGITTYLALRHGGVQPQINVPGGK